MNKKTIITTVTAGFIAGILLTIFSYHAYMVYQFKSQLLQVEGIVNQQGVALQQIINLINSNGKK